MKCKIIFTVNGIPVELELDFDSTGPLTNLELLKALENNPEKTKELTLLLYDSALNFRDIKNVSINELKNTKGLTGNCTVNFITLQPKYSTITFLDTSANILLLDKLSIGRNENIKGRIINSQGQELFVVRNDEEDIKRLASFLNTRKHLRESDLLIDPSSKYKELMDKIIEKRNKYANPISKEDYSGLILDFIYNKSKYNGIFIDGLSAISILSNIHKTIKDWVLPISYDTPFINNLNSGLSSLASLSDSNNNIKKGDYFIKYTDLYKLLKEHYPNLLKSLNITSLSAFLKFLNKSIDETQDRFKKLKESDSENLKELNLLLFENLNIENTVVETILYPLFKQEPDFTFVFKRTTDKGIILHHEFETIESKYGIGYDTIASMDIINNNYRGYKIYKQNDGNITRYFISRGYLTEDSDSRAFNSLEEASKYIDDSLIFQNLEKNSLIEFKKLKSVIGDNGEIIYENSININSIKLGIRFNEGLIIEVLDVPISESVIVSGNEASILNGRLSDFLKLIKTWNIENNLKLDIINSMNTPEKAVTFLYKVNERLLDDRSNNDIIREIYEQISTAPLKYYYIDSRTSYGKNKFSYRVIPTTGDEVINYKNESGKNIPTITWMNAIKQTLENLFPGLKINLLPARNIKELKVALDGLVDPNIDKAFIYNGEIYVNTTIAKSSDLLHEYIHIILGCLKTNPNLVLNYELLLRFVVSSKEGSKILEDLRLTYPDISEIDLMEEVFTNLFSQYMRGITTPNTKFIFNASEKEINKMTETIFNTKIGDMKDFYGKTITSVFAKFNKEIAKLLRDNGIDYDQIGLGRKYSNYISKLIKEGKILEEC